MREGEGAAGVRSDDLEATIRSATASKAEIVQKHRDGNQLGIRIERTTLCQLCAKEPRARHVVEKPGRRFGLCLRVGFLDGVTIGQGQIQWGSVEQR